MADLISRAVAIEALSTPCDKRYRNGVWETCLDNIETAIRNIPAMNAAPVVHGRWIDENPDDSLDPRMRCSICNEVESPLIKWRYCPNCGARMDEK